MQMGKGSSTTMPSICTRHSTRQMPMRHGMMENKQAITSVSTVSVVRGPPMRTSWPKDWAACSKVTASVLGWNTSCRNPVKFVTLLAVSSSSCAWMSERSLSGSQPSRQYRAGSDHELALPQAYTIFHWRCKHARDHAACLCAGVVWQWQADEMVKVIDEYFRLRGCWIACCGRRM